MPELPDVEAHHRFAEEHAAGHRVAGVACSDPQVLRNTTAQGLGRALADATVLSVQRRGKWLWLVTDAASDVLVHFGMTGSFHWHQDGTPPCAGDLVRFDLGAGTLAYHATRKLGGIWLVRGPEERREITGQLGVDGLDADAEAFRAALSGSRAGLKAALLDQSRIAGIGNLLADELCWQAGVHPAASCADLRKEQWAELADTLARILEAGLRAGQVPEGDGFLTGVRDAGRPRCPRCGGPLTSGTVAGRSTRWCPAEQPDPR